jgi:hypothetical protein
MDEGTEAPTEVAFFKGYAGSEIPRNFQVLQGSNSYLGLNFQNNGSIITLHFDQEQDFENPNQQSYIVSFSFDNVNAIFLIKIQNIFDNPPNVFQINTACVVEEYNAVNFASGCLFVSL